VASITTHKFIVLQEYASHNGDQGHWSATSEEYGIPVESIFSAATERKHALGWVRGMLKALQTTHPDTRYRIVEQTRSVTECMVWGDNPAPGRSPELQAMLDATADQLTQRGEHHGRRVVMIDGRAVPISKRDVDAMRLRHQLNCR